MTSAAQFPFSFVCLFPFYFQNSFSILRQFCKRVKEKEEEKDASDERHQHQRQQQLLQEKQCTSQAEKNRVE